jgi:predicted molibdopterin-dependent oxidoreductase YjgC
VEVRIDGIPVTVRDGASILDACDAAGRYVPRLCSYPGLGSACEMGVSCGVCAVEVLDLPVQACCTLARPGMSVTTLGPEIRAERLRRLAAVLNTHPHICLSCPDRDGCTRQECTYGVPEEARCCDEFGRCEFGKLVTYLDPGLQLRRWAMVVLRDSRMEGRLRREPGLCIGCGRCVLVCSKSPAAGNALQMEDIVGPGGTVSLEAIQSGALPQGAVRSRAMPVKATLRLSGCTFCGQCALVCPTGAVTAPGDAGSRWLDGCRASVDLAKPVLPPDSWRLLTEEELAAIAPVPGVFQLADATGQVLRIGGAADLSRGVGAALTEACCRYATRFWFERAELYTQRESELLARFAQEHGHLPPGNDLGDDLFGEDLSGDDLD